LNARRPNILNLPTRPQEQRLHRGSRCPCQCTPVLKSASIHPKLQGFATNKSHAPNTHTSNPSVDCIYRGLPKIKLHSRITQARVRPACTHAVNERCMGCWPRQICKATRPQNTALHPNADACRHPRQTAAGAPHDRGTPTIAAITRSQITRRERCTQPACLGVTGALSSRDKSTRAPGEPGRRHWVSRVMSRPEDVGAAAGDVPHLVTGGRAGRWGPGLGTADIARPHWRCRRC
jgi:hypothetical protein